MKIKVGYPYFEDIRNKFVVTFYVYWYDRKLQYKEKTCVKKFEVDCIFDSQLIEKLHEFCTWLTENTYISDTLKPPHFDEFKSIFESLSVAPDELFFDSYELFYFDAKGMCNYIFNEHGERL